MKKFIAAAFLGLAAIAGVAIAQTPSIFITSPVGSETIQARNSGAAITSIYLSQARDAVGFSTQAPSTGFSLAFTQYQSQMIISSASTLAAGTITLSPTPYNGQINCFYTKPIVTALTLAAGTGGATINDGVTATAALTRYCYIYSATGTVWNRAQ